MCVGGGGGCGCGGIFCNDSKQILVIILNPSHWAKCLSVLSVYCWTLLQWGAQSVHALTSDPAVKCECKCMHMYRVACLFICVWHFKPPYSKYAKHFFPWISLLLLCYHLAHGWTTTVSPSWTKLLFYASRIAGVWMQKKRKSKRVRGEIKSL